MTEKKQELIYRLKFNVNNPSGIIAMGEEKTASEWAEIWPELKSGKFNPDWFELVAQEHIEVFVYRGFRLSNSINSNNFKEHRCFFVRLDNLSDKEAEYFRIKFQQIVDEYKINNPVL